MWRQSHTAGGLRHKGVTRRRFDLSSACRRVRSAGQRGQSTDCVQRNSAIVFPEAGVAHHGVPDLRRPPGVRVRRDGGDPALADRAQEVRLQLDRGEPGRAVGEQRAGGQPAGGVGQRDHGGRVQVAVGRQQVGPDVERGLEPAGLVGGDDEPQQARERAREDRVELVCGVEPGGCHAGQPSERPGPSACRARVGRRPTAVRLRERGRRHQGGCGSASALAGGLPEADDVALGVLEVGGEAHVADRHLRRDGGAARGRRSSPAWRRCCRRRRRSPARSSRPVPRASMPPLMKPASVGPLSPLGPDMTSV